MKRRTLAGPALLLALALPLAACGDNSKASTDSPATSAAAKAVTVSGKFGAKPQVKVDAPLKLKKTTSFVSIKGGGSTLQKGMTYQIQLTLADGQSGKTLISTYDQGQRPLSGTAGQGTNLFPVVENALIGKKTGSRVVVEATPSDTYGGQGNPQLGVKAGDPVVLVADLVSTAQVLDAPKGTAVKPPADAPTLQTGKDGVPTGFSFGSLKKPAKPQVIPLIKGNGPKIATGDSATVNYLGSVWGSKKVFDQSYTRHQTATFPIGQGGVIKCWDQGLVGVPQGSRVLLVCPPDTAYGAQGQPPTIPKNATLTFVVDVLGVS